MVLQGRPVVADRHARVRMVEPTVVDGRVDRRHLRGSQGALDDDVTVQVEEIVLKRGDHGPLHHWQAPAG